ncbi:MAG: hypothetical protein P1V51_14765, partial [Deltaproteobacteria bacterium]|nr:hypothetical protein [Deltaproteobacteria bacterium]
MRSLRLALALLLSSLLTLPALADAPAFVPVQGYLSAADGTPTEGETTLVLSLYDDPSTATPLFTETQQVLVEGGHFTVYLGQVDTLDLALFRDQGSLFLGVAVDGEAELTPRLPVGTTPYAGFAQYAGRADSALSADDAATLGGVAPGELRRTADPVDWAELANVPTDLATGPHTVNTDVLAALGCADGEVAKWNGAAWACAVDVDTDTNTQLTEAEVEAFVTNGALDLAPGTTVGGAVLAAGPHTTNTDTLAALGCLDGQVAKWNGPVGAWECAPDLNTGADTLAALGCGAGEVAKWDGAAWACAVDVDTDTNTQLSEAEVDAFVANNGYSMGAHTIDTDTLATLGCAAGEVAKWDGAAWACAVDVDTDTNTQL